MKVYGKMIIARIVQLEPYFEYDHQISNFAVIFRYFETFKRSKRSKRLNVSTINLFIMFFRIAEKQTGIKEKGSYR